MHQNLKSPGLGLLALFDCRDTRAAVGNSTEGRVSGDAVESFDARCNLEDGVEPQFDEAGGRAGVKMVF